MKIRTNYIHRFFIFTILFINGYQFILPVEYTDDLNKVFVTIPWWASNLQLIPGVFFTDFLLIFYLVLFGWSFLKSVGNIKFAHSFFISVLALALIGIFSTIVNLEIGSDFFEAGKILLMATFFLLVVYWVMIMGPLFIIRSFTFGIVVSCVINLYFTFGNPVRLLGGLPMLLGQNGPGGSAGFLMFFAVIYSGVSNSKWDKLFVLLFVLISSFILIISYSKLGIIMGFFGVLSYLLFQFRFRGVLINAKKLGYVFFFFLSIFIWSKSTKSGSLLLEGASTFLSYKFGEDGSEYIDSGDKERLYYYFAVGEVFIQNPIFGVGYNGFYNAILETNAHRSGEMSEEEGSKNANPHNAFLYYISANGLIGWIITIVVFMFSLSIYFKYFVFYGGVGVLIVFLISGIFIIHTNTLISFFNTPIMYIPTAIVCALVELRRTNYNMCSLDFQQDKIIK